MEQTSRGIAVAVGLMRMALGLLDREDETLGAASLQHAIDLTLKQRPLAPSEELDPEVACLVAAIPLGPLPDSSTVGRVDEAGRRRRP